MRQQKYARLAFMFCALATVLYNSWPLGYMLNNRTAHSGLASDLERSGQPYSWVFVFGDILSAFCVVAVCFLILLKLRPKAHANVWGIAWVGLLLFGVGTAVATVVPARCVVSATLRCGTVVGPGLGLDALFSSIAALGLFASLISACVLSLRYRFPVSLVRLTETIVIAWPASGLLFLAFATSSGTAVEAQLWQQISFIVDGLALLVIGLVVHGVWRRQSTRR